MKSWFRGPAIDDGGRLTREQVAAALAVMPMPLAAVHADGRVEVCNAAFAALVGETPEALRGADALAFALGADTGLLRAHLREIAAGSRDRAQAVLSLQRNRTVHVEAFHLPVPDDDGLLVGLRLTDRTDDIERARDDRGRQVALAVQTAAAEVLSGSVCAADLGETILQALVPAGGWSAGALWRVDETAGALVLDTLWHPPNTIVPRWKAHSRQHPLGPDEDLPGRAWEAQAVVWAERIERDFASMRVMKAVDEGIQSGVATPISIEGTVVGVLELVSAEPRARTEPLAATLLAIGTQIGARWTAVQSEDALRSSEEHHRAVTEMARDAVLNIDGEGTIIAANRAAEAMFGYERSGFDGRSVEVVLPEGLPALATESGRRHEDGLVQRENLDSVGRHRNGETLELEVSVAERRSESGRAFTIWARDVTQRRREESALVYQALHDSLTDLPNRGLLQDRLSRAVLVAHRHTQHLALLFMDLDRFKDVNDTFGHHVGDQLLQQVSRRLASTMRESDTVARLGGDEFAVLLPSTDQAGAEFAARRILETLREPVVVEGKRLDVAGSLGIAIYPAHGADVATLMRRADMAMYAAKRGSCGFAVYDADRDEQGSLRLLRIAELRRAIEQEQLVLHYQPKVNLQDGRTENVEALVRWLHPERGMVPPDEFIPLAEETGLMHDLTRWVVNEALRQHCAWRECGVSLRVAVNFSAGMLQDERLVPMVLGLLEHWNVDPTQLEMEITESAFMESPEKARETVRELHRAGLWVSIDDFGTGYSSLGYLKHLRVDEVKIDKSFVMEMDNNRDDEPIVRSVVDLGHNFGLRVVAEGVDNRRTIEMLRAMNCDMAQGFYLSRPLPSAELLAWVTDPSKGLLLAS